MDPTKATLAGMTDEDLHHTVGYAHASLSEHAEMDCSYGGEEPCQTCDDNRESIRLAEEEMERRSVLGIYVGPSLEERLAPYGIEWEREQRDRVEGAW